MEFVYVSSELQPKVSITGCIEEPGDLSSRKEDTSQDTEQGANPKRRKRNSLSTPQEINISKWWRRMQNKLI
jgi:hypothetical protein